MNHINFGISVILTLASVFMYFASLKVVLHDILRKGIWGVTLGAIVLALAHLLESIALMMHMPEDLVTTAHHFAVLLGFLMIAFGIVRLSSGEVSEA